MRPETQFSTEKDEESKPSLEESNEFSHFNNKLSIQDFNLLKVLGKGSWQGDAGGDAMRSVMRNETHSMLSRHCVNRL